MRDRQAMYDDTRIVEQDRPVLDKVLDVVDAMGLNYSCVMGRGDTPRGVGVILEGGIEHMKALNVDGFICNGGLDKDAPLLADNAMFITCPGAQPFTWTPSC